MSATFKNAKKKLSQNELRRCMNELRNKNSSAKKITSPLAKYNDAGQLTCILCKSVVKSEAVWTVHLNSKQHKENIEAAKRQKTALVNRRVGTPSEEPPAKKIKGILKNPSDSEVASNGEVQVVHNTNVQNQAEHKDSMEIIPEGFFDDPKLDAKARNLEYKDPVEEEWERFQREMREANFECYAIIAEDQEEATNERQIDEIEEQINNWSRVLHLEKKKKDIVSTVKDDHMETNSDSDEEVEFNEFFDWRSKESFT